MKIAERIILLLLLAALIAGGVWIYAMVQKNHQETLDAVARGEFEIRETPIEYTEENWRALYPGTVTGQIASTTVHVSVADSLPERIQGLSDTPFLPENVVKLFVFNASGTHSIWMKDMQYALDIMWLNQGGEVVHIEENIAPDTFPEAFASPTTAWFVVEANAGFVAKHGIVLGDDFVITSR